MAAKEQELRGHLGSFGIKGSLAMQKMRQLSGGQAVRVGLAAVAYAEPHLLLLVSLVVPSTAAPADFQQMQLRFLCIMLYQSFIK